MRRYALLLLAAFCYSIPAASDPTHVSLTYPAGGETFSPGSHVNIEWQLLVPHDQQNWDLYFSSDGGASWTAIQEDIPVSMLSYDWTVPDVETMHGRIKIVQDNAGLDYVSTCTDFSIEAVPATANGSGSLPEISRSMRSYPNPFGGSTRVDYTVDEAGRVTLEVYDVQGHIVSTLVDSQRNRGEYVETFDAHDLPSGTYLFILRTPSSATTRVMIHTE